MSDPEVRVRDVYEGAYLLCRGLKMTDLAVTGTNGRKVVTFTFAGRNAAELDEEYRTGRAVANLTLYKSSLNHLKDRMFDKLRELEKRERRVIHAPNPRRRTRPPQARN